MLDAATAEQVFADHHRWVWGLGYRMLGVAADADDLVQDTFARALSRPPPDRTRSWTPWIMKVATRLAIDRLRARKARPYDGPWLPGPASDPALLLAAPQSASPSVAYELAESATLAFLLALEALTPRQRAVLVLRHVFDLSVAETASVLDLSASNVKVIAHRARAALARHPDQTTRAATVGATTYALFDAIRRGALAEVKALLAPDIVAMTDANGEHSSARRPLHGPDAVARFYLGIQRFGGQLKVQVAIVNGVPALIVDRLSADRFAPRSVLQLVLDAEGKVVRVLNLQAHRKLAALAS